MLFSGIFTKFGIGTGCSDLNLFSTLNNNLRYNIVFSEYTNKYNLSKSHIVSFLSKEILSSYSKGYYRYGCAKSDKTIARFMTHNGYIKYLNNVVKLFTTKYRTLSIDFKHYFNTFFYKNIKNNYLSKKLINFTKHSNIVDNQTLSYKKINFIEKKKYYNLFTNNISNFYKKNN